jgi:hypothetical protein
MTSFIAAGGSGRSTSVIPAVPAASSVTTIAFIRHLPVLLRAVTAHHADAVMTDRHEPAFESLDSIAALRTWPEPIVATLLKPRSVPRSTLAVSS